MKSNKFGAMDTQSNTTGQVVCAESKNFQKSLDLESEYEKDEPALRAQISMIEQHEAN